MSVFCLLRLNDGVVKGSRRSSFARDFSCDPLINLRRQPGIDENRQLGLAQHVYEAGRHDHPLRFDRACTGLVSEIAYSRDLAGADANITGIPGRAGAIDDVTVGDHEIKRRRVGSHYPDRRDT